MENVARGEQMATRKMYLAPRLLLCVSLLLGACGTEELDSDSTQTLSQALFALEVVSEEMPSGEEGSMEGVDQVLDTVEPILNAPPLGPAQNEALKCLQELESLTAEWTKVTDAHFIQYRACKAQFYGVSSDTYLEALDAMIQVELDAEIPSDKKPTPEHVAAMQDWLIDRAGRIEFRWDRETGNLAGAGGVLTSQLPLNPALAKTSIEDVLLPRLAGLCGFGPDSEWEGDTFEKLNQDSEYQLRYVRTISGLPVEFDYLEIGFDTDQHHPDFMRANTVSVRCHGEPPPSFSLSPTLELNDALPIAVAAFEPEEEAIDTLAKLLLTFADDCPHLVWRIEVHKVSDDRLVYVDAHSGEVIKNAKYRMHDAQSGSVKYQVRRAYLTGTTQGAFAYAKVYEDDYRTDYLGQTSSTGTYTDLDHPTTSPHDHTWEIYFDGSYAKDNYDSELPSFDAGTNWSYGTLATTHQRRGEVFYHLNYARKFAKAAWSSIPTYEPIYYGIPTGNPNGSDCGGNSMSAGIYLFGWCEGYDYQEQLFRTIVFHEWGHSPMAASENWPTCTLCQSWREGSADYLNYAANRVEFLRSNGEGSGCGPNAVCGGTDDFYPDDTYDNDSCPSDCDGGDHDAGNIFAGVYLDLHYELGWRDTLARVFKTLDFVNGSTAWTGSNSFYEKMLEADEHFWSIKAWQLTIGQAWKRHDDTVSKYSWDWKDQWPGTANPAYMLRATATDSWTTVDDGPDAYLPDLAFDYFKDRDYFWFYTYSGETYKFRTWNLCSEVDPAMSFIRIVSGNENIVTTSYNCADPGYGLNPCIAVIAGSNAWAGIRIWETGDNHTGCYDFEFKTEDDIGDTAQASRAAAPNNTWYEAEWEETGDVDYFKVYVPSSGTGVTLTVETCKVPSESAPDTEISLYYYNNLTTPVATDNNSGTCSSRASKIEYSVPSGKTGFYFLKVHEWGDNATGKYQVRALVAGGSRDIGGSSKSTATYLSNSELTGRYIAADFESGSDEDWFKVYLYENHHVTFHTADLQGSADTMMEIWDSDVTGYKLVPDSSKRWMREDDDGSHESLASHLHFVAPKNGYYYLRLESYGSSTGAYTLSMQKMGNHTTSYPSYP